VIVVRTAIAPSMTFAEVVDRVHAALDDAYRHQDLPYGHLLTCLGGSRPLYRVIFNFIPSIPASALELAGVTVEPLPMAARPQSSADVSVQVQSKAGGLACRFVYRSDAFSRSRMQQFAQQFERLLTAAMDAPGARLATGIASPARDVAAQPQYVG
jgi:non-ribosomal peptide synthetase component F